MRVNIKKSILSVLKLLCVFLFSILFLFGLYYLFQRTGWLGHFSNIQELKKIILSAGFFSYFIFALIQFLQVVILPLPSMVTTVAGIVIFGSFATFLLSLLAILLGSVCAYFLGRAVGIRLLIWSVGKEKTLKLQKLMDKGKIAFFLMMLFPFFPDDVLCMFAGVFNMNFKFFLLTNLITRTVGIFCTCFLGYGIFRV